MQIYVIYNKGRVGYMFKVYLKVLDWFWVLFFHVFFILTFYLFYLIFLLCSWIFIVHSYTFQTDDFDEASNVLIHNHSLLLSPSPTSVPPFFHSLPFYFHVIYRCVCMIPDTRENMQCLSSGSGFLCLLWWPPILSIFLKIAQFPSSSWLDYALLYMSNTFALASPCWNP